MSWERAEKIREETMSDVTRRMAKRPPMSETQKATPRPWHQGGKGKEELMSPNTIFGADGAAIAQFYGVSLHKTFDELDMKLCAEGLGNIATVLRAVNSHDKLLEALKGLNGFFREGSKFYISKLGGGITNGDQEIIDKLFIAAEAAIKSAEESPK